MNADGKALFATICADPEDDTSRLVYADWLDEQGDTPRAEALRMSVERRRLPDWEPRAWVLDARLMRSYQQNRKAWNAELPKLENGGWSTSLSGLVEFVRVHSPRSLLDQESLIFATGPITSMSVNLDFGNKPEDASALASCPSMSRIRTLAFDGMVPPASLGLPALAASPFLADLRELERSECGDEDDLLEYFSECPAFPNLESLKLYRAWFQPVGCQALSKSPLLQSLRRLNVSRANVHDAGLRHLIRSANFADLRDLRLAENDLTARPFSRFFGIDWQELTHLDLSSNSIGPTMIRHLAACATMKNLRWLDLSASHGAFGDAAAKSLARSRHLDELRVLIIGFNDLSGVGLDALSRATWAPRLARLELTGTHMSHRELRVLASPTFGNLRWLDLGYGMMTDEKIPHLLAIPWISQLTHLVLSNNAIGYGGARLLASAPLDNLENLDLTSNKIAPAERELLRARFGDRVELISQ